MQTAKNLVVGLCRRSHHNPLQDRYGKPCLTVGKRANALGGEISDFNSDGMMHDLYYFIFICQKLVF